MADSRYLDQHGLNHYHDLIKTEKVVATQTTATNSWTGKVDATGLALGKTIILTLPKGSPEGYNSLTLTLSGGTKTKAIPVVEMSGQPLTRKRDAGTGMVLVYDGTSWWNTSETTEGTNKVANYKETTMSASKWSSNVYSFEDLYASSKYDIDVMPSVNITEKQLEAFNAAKIIGSTTSNTVKAHGDVPTIDIPVTVKIATEAESSGEVAVPDTEIKEIVTTQYNLVFGG